MVHASVNGLAAAPAFPGGAANLDEGVAQLAEVGHHGAVDVGDVRVGRSASRRTTCSWR